MTNAAHRMAQMLRKQVYLLKQDGLHTAAAQAADEIRHLKLLAALQSER